MQRCIRTLSGSWGGRRGRTKKKKEKYRAPQIVFERIPATRDCHSTMCSSALMCLAGLLEAKQKCRYESGWQWDKKKKIMITTERGTLTILEDAHGQPQFRGRWLELSLWYDASECFGFYFYFFSFCLRCLRAGLHKVRFLFEPAHSKTHSKIMCLHEDILNKCIQICWERLKIM